MKILLHIIWECIAKTFIAMVWWICWIARLPSRLPDRIKCSTKKDIVYPYRIGCSPTLQFITLFYCLLFFCCVARLTPNCRINLHFTINQDSNTKIMAGNRNCLSMGMCVDETRSTQTQIFNFVQVKSRGNANKNVHGWVRKSTKWKRFWSMPMVFENEHRRYSLVCNHVPFIVALYDFKKGLPFSEWRTANVAVTKCRCMCVCLFIYFICECVCVCLCGLWVCPMWP